MFSDVKPYSLVEVHRILWGPWGFYLLVESLSQSVNVAYESSHHLSRVSQEM
jgi:hypothetical protein